MRPLRHLSILAIIAVATLVFVCGQARTLGFAQSYGAVPMLIGGAWDALLEGRFSFAVAGTLSRLVTALFLHGDIEHILFNMVFLWVFGSLTSQHLGQWTALLAFFVCGICGNVVQVWLHRESSAAIIGASGAVCGFEGIFLGLALGWKLPWPDVWPLAHPIPPLQLGAFAVLGFLFDVYLLGGGNSQVAYGAHVGGFLSGLAIAALITTIYPTAAAFHGDARKK